MITLNSEKGLIEVEKWEDIASRPGFIVNLNPKEHKLTSIIGRYIIRDTVACGLSDCHTAHQKGYIVTTDRGAETNIGKDCGAREFGVEFDTMSRKFEADITERNNREALATFSFRADDLQAELESLRRGAAGADWLQGKLSEITHAGKGWPDSLVTRINQMARTRSGQLTLERQATAEEREIAKVRDGRDETRPSDLIVEQIVGEIRGISALYPENSIREIVAIQLEGRLKDFRKADIDAMTQKQLREWVQWVNSVELLLTRARDTLAAGRLLFERENLGQFGNVLKHYEASAFGSYLRTLPSTR